MSMTIKTKLQDVKRALILDEAGKLFESSGFEDLKVSDLAKSVGVSVGTIYGLFDSKEGLYMAYVKQQISGFLEEMERSCAETADAEERLEKIFRLKFSHFVSKRKSIEECAKNNPLFFSNIRRSEPEMLERVFQKVAEIIRDIDPAIEAEKAMEMAYLFSGLSDGYVTYWLAHDGDLLAQVPKLKSQMLSMIKGC